MKVQNIVRKAVALGSGAALVGTTLMGAFAYDLSTYPAKFVVDGKFDGKIVVGEKASTSDVLGAIDIAASLQGASVSKVTIPGQAGTTSLSGDVAQVGTGSDKLELRESIGKVTDTLTETDLTGLKSGKITTAQGSTDFHQYLRLKDGSALQDMSVNFVQNDNDQTSDFLVVEPNSPFMEWEIQFPNGMESKVTSGELKDMEDRTFNVMGTDFNIVKATETSTSVELTLMGGSTPDTLREGETKTYTIDGKDYEVTLVFVSDPNSGDAAVKFSVNGEMTQSLSASDTDTLTGGLQIGVRDILVNAREGVASFYLGAQKVTFTDSNAANSAWDGKVEINNQNMQDAQADISGQTSGSNYKITSIKYRVEMDATNGATAYVPAGKGLRALMKRPETLVSSSLDMQYAGLTAPVTKDVKLSAVSDNRYRLDFTNTLGQAYDVPFVTNKNVVFAYGDDTHNLVFVESEVIARNDYLVVSYSGVDADRAPTNVLRYTGFDTTDMTASFEDIAGSATLTVPTVAVTSGNATPLSTGNLVVGGHTYAIKVANLGVKDSTVLVDLNGDSGFGGNAVPITTWGGAVVTLGTNTSINASANNLLAVTNKVPMTYTMAARNFDTSTIAETLAWTLDALASNKVSLTLGAYNGPLTNETAGAPTWSSYEVNSKDVNSDHDVAMTDFGTMVDHYSPSSNNNADELTLSIPQQQRLAQVYVTLGQTSSVAGAAGSADKVNPIAVGLAVQDKDAPAVGTENLIVVGGPCANTVAATLMGSPSNCAEGFEAGKASIKSFENSGKVAILVAGYSAQDTQGASRVLAAYKDYASSLKGSEVEVVVADLNSIKVQAVTK